MAKQDVLLKDVEIPEGYEPTGEYRKLRKGEYSLNRLRGGFSGPFELEESSDTVIVLRRIEPTHVRLARALVTLKRSLPWPDYLHAMMADADQLAEKALAEWEASAK